MNNIIIDTYFAISQNFDRLLLSSSDNDFHSKLVNHDILCYWLVYDNCLYSNNRHGFIKWVLKITYKVWIRGWIFLDKWCCFSLCRVSWINWKYIKLNCTLSKTLPKTCVLQFIDPINLFWHSFHIKLWNTCWIPEYGLSRYL